MLGDEDLDAAERWVDNWESGLAERLRQTRELSQRVSALTVTVHSDDGLVEMTVGSSGAITGLWLDERIRRQPADRTAEQILAVLRQATTELAAQVARVTEETVGTDNETGRAVVASFTSRIVPDGGTDHGRR